MVLLPIAKRTFNAGFLNISVGAQHLSAAKPVNGVCPVQKIQLLTLSFQLILIVILCLTLTRSNGVSCIATMVLMQITEFLSGNFRRMAPNGWPGKYSATLLVKQHDAGAPPYI